VERVLELVNIAANKNTVPGDKSALVPGGLRMGALAAARVPVCRSERRWANTAERVGIGTPAMATRGLAPADFETVAALVDRGIKLTRAISDTVPGKKLKDFKAVLEDGGAAFPALAALRRDVISFARSFPAIG
jgi:glycine hydroxymethyltransferase